MAKFILGNKKKKRLKGRKKTSLDVGQSNRRPAEQSGCQPVRLFAPFTSPLYFLLFSLPDQGTNA